MITSGTLILAVKLLHLHYCCGNVGILKEELELTLNPSVLNQFFFHVLAVFHEVPNQDVFLANDAVAFLNHFLRPI